MSKHQPAPKSSNPPDPESASLYDLYKTLGLSVDLINPKSQFTVHDLHTLLTELPYTSPHFRPNYFAFTFIKDGHGRYTVDELAFDLQPLTVYFTNPGNYRTFHWQDIQEAWHITFNEAYLKANVHPNIFAEFPFLLTETVRPQTLAPAVYREFEELYGLIAKEYQGNSAYKDRIIGSLFVVLLLKIKEYFWTDYNPIYEGNRSSQIVKTFKRDLEDHYRDLLSGNAEKAFRVADYAARQHLHPNYLTNVIKAKTGKSISTWITGKTITEAKSLLLNSGLAIKEIAYRLGFSESTHFSNYFKKYTDLSPAQFRRQG